MTTTTLDKSYCSRFGWRQIMAIWLGKMLINSGWKNEMKISNAINLTSNRIAALYRTLLELCGSSPADYNHHIWKWAQWLLEPGSDRLLSSSHQNWSDNSATAFWSRAWRCLCNIQQREREDRVPGSRRKDGYFRLTKTFVSVRWVWTMPLDSPVVPLEYISHAMASMSTSTLSGHSINGYKWFNLQSNRRGR